MKKTTPRIPIRLPTNSMVSTSSISIGANINTIRAPTIIIGIPTPIQIFLEAMMNTHLENVYEVFDVYEI